jgi:virulence factor Mce-like protein
MTEVRDHRTTGKVNRARVQLELKRATRSGIIVAAALIVGLAITAYVASNIGVSFTSSTQSVSFYVNDATAVVPQADEVRYLGIPAGRVSSVRMHGTQPVITASWQTKYGKIYKNARLVVRPNTALEDMYVDVVNPGTPSAGLANTSDPLPAAATDTSVNLDDVLDTFNADARRSLRTLLDQLGNGLADRGAALKEGFVELAPFLQLAGNVSTQLADRATLVKQLVHNTSTVMTDLSQRQQELRTLVSSGSSALTTLANGSSNLNATLHELPTTIDDVNSSFASVSGVVGDVDAALKSLDPVVKELPSALSSVQKLSNDASPAVKALQTPVTKLVPLVQTLSPLSASLSQAVSGLSPQVSTINHTVSDLVSCRTGVEGFFQWNPSLAKYGDERGLSPRGNLAVGIQSSGLLDSPWEYAPQACTAGTAVGGRVPTAADEH